MDVLFDETGIDTRILEAVKNGDELTVTRRFKRNGVVYASGDSVILGDLQNDDILCRGVDGHGPWVATREYYDAYQADRKKKKYRRDVLVSLEQQLARAETSFYKSQDDVTRAEQQLKIAKAKVRQASQDVKTAKQSLETALESAP